MKSIILFLTILFIGTASYSMPKKKQIFDQGSVKVTLLPMNTAQSDFGPALIGDSLYFTSFSDDGKKRPNNQKSGFCDLFSLKIDEHEKCAFVNFGRTIILVICWQ